MPFQGSHSRVPKKDRALKAYSGGAEKAQFAPWVYALHDVHKNRAKTLRDVHRFIPVEKDIKEHILMSWMKEVEDGTAKFTPRMRQWVKDALEIDAQTSMREAVLETSKTLTYFVKRMREEDKLPPGGPVTLKYVADAAGFISGKLSEAAALTNGKQTGNTANVNKFVLNLGEKPKQKPKITAQVIDAVARELPAGGDR